MGMTVVFAPGMVLLEFWIDHTTCLLLKSPVRLLSTIKAKPSWEPLRSLTLHELHMGSLHILLT